MREFEAQVAAAMRDLGVRIEAHDLARYDSDDYELKLRAFAGLVRVFGVSIETLLYGEDEAARIAAEHEGAGCDGHQREPEVRDRPWLTRVQVAQLFQRHIPRHRAVGGQRDG